VDFVLARLQRRASEDQGVQPAIAGTCGYMCPEQVQGEPATARADIFSFGAVLYEMVTGRPAFQGASPAAVLASVLRDDPPPMALWTPHCPPALAKVIEQCLRKDPKRRSQHMGDVRLALEEITPVPVRPRWRALDWRPKALLYSAIALILLTAQWVIFKRVAEPPPNSALMPLTSFPGEERNAAWSPDGRQVAFTLNGDKQDNYDIYILQPGSSQTFRLTSDPGVDDYPAWSPDGRWIAYRHTDRTGYTLELISPLGGPARTLIRSNLLMRPAWTPNSQALVIEMPPEPGQPKALWAVSVDNGRRLQLTWPPSGIPGDSLPALSPDGRTLVFIRGTARQAAE
jgi:serine/threonine protein kinase